MNLFRMLAVATLTISAFTIIPSGANTGNFNEYADGAMTIYSQFKQPSVEESEQFYAFIKERWQKADCSSQCVKDGKKAGELYAAMYQVDIDKSADKYK